MIWRGVLLLLVLVASLALATAAAAQTDPRGNLRTIDTPHFRVHFRADHDSLARRVALYAEEAHAALSRELVAPRGKIDLAIADNTDNSNGYAQTFPSNRVVLFAVPPIGIQELRFQDEWLRLVTIHELAHVFHLDRARGLWRLGRFVFGRNPIFFPNQLTPSWVKEGLAVYYESKLTGSGRNVSTEAPLVARAAALGEAIPPMSRWSLATTRFPQGQTAYAWGSQLMLRAARAGGDTGLAPGAESPMRRFVDEVAAHPIPFLLNNRARESFGVDFRTLFDRYRDSLRAVAAAADTSGDIPWRTVSAQGWHAEAPRWKGNDTLVWAASNGREVAGLYTALVRDGVASEPRRVARRNSLDANVPAGRDSLVFAQGDFRDLYTYRNDLWLREHGKERQLTHGARLTQPDARNGNIVAVGLRAGASMLMLGTELQIGHRPLKFQWIPLQFTPRARNTNNWAEPRFSADGRLIAAIELLPTGEQRVVVMSLGGETRAIITGARAVFSSPSFTPDGTRLVWASDRSGRMQLETAPLDGAWLTDRTAPPDTMNWRGVRETVRQASNVSTAVYQPTVSPDGRYVAALVYKVDGFHVSVAPLDTTGPVARNTWYPPADQSVAAARREDSLEPARITTPSRGYAVARQLLPRYWFPQIGTGRDGGATYGLSSSGSDILERHDWLLQGTANPRLGEIDASGAYRYRGFGQPILDFAASQEWDATFRVADTANSYLGDIARRRRFASMSASFARPRVRLSLNGSVGAQYEWRDFTADIDSLLGDERALTRVGTRYPSLFASGSVSTLRRAGRSIAFEEGVTLSTSTSYRWRSDAPSATGSWRGLSTLRGYLPLDLPGFSRHVLSARVTGGLADNRTATELSVGGTSGQSAEIVPGLAIGDPARSFPVRGVAPDAQRGTRAVGGTLEYRVPLLMLQDTPGPFTLYADRLSLALFSDAARAWCPAALARTTTPVCERPGARDGIIASAGAEITVDLAVQYDVPYRLRIGAAAPYAAPAGVPRRGAFYVTLGSYF